MSKAGIYEQAKRYSLGMTLDLLGYEAERKNLQNGIMPAERVEGYENIKELAKSYRE